MPKVRYFSGGTASEMIAMEYGYGIIVALCTYLKLIGSPKNHFWLRLVDEHKLIDEAMIKYYPF